ncbi:hypothetical protein [Streptomyces sp. BH104]|uniref:hypothetical protein n=1 Tax=Streptomyces sp. BH104 TaxID=3410407 RepID=UPI003BB4BD77
MKLIVTGETGPDEINVNGGQKSRIIDVTAALVSSVNGKTGAITGLAETADVQDIAENTATAVAEPIAEQAATSAVTTHTTATDPHGDRAYADTLLAGGGKGLAGAYYVAASDAPAKEKARADYACDGTADDVQIQQAINAAKAVGGGIVQLSGGTFNCSATPTITGNTDEDNADTITLRGAGAQATTLNMAANVNGLELTNWAMANISDLGIAVSGSGNGIHATAVLSGNEVSFWHSSFRNLRITGGFVATNTGWGMDLQMPWRSTFENIEIEGTRNGIILRNQGTVQNAGDCTFTRMFIEIVGNSGTAIRINSPSNNMNQNNFNMVEAGANGTGCTGILIDGTSGGASQRFWGLNLEQFATCIDVATGESNVFDCNYVTCDTGQPGNVMFRCGTNSYNNSFSAKWVNVASSDSLQLINDLNTTSNCPNVFAKIRIENNSSGTVTYAKASSTVLRDITTFNTGNPMPAGLLQYPLSTVNDPSPTPAKHNLITWTQDPRTLRSTGDATTAGVVYLSKIDIANRATVVSNILVGVVTAGATLTAGQNLIGLYDASGTRLAVSTDQTTAWATVGLKTAAITPQTLAVGSYYVAILSNGTTRPSFATGAGHGQDGLTNVGLTTATAAFLTSGTGQTALPATITLGSGGPNSGSRWAALS